MKKSTIKSNALKAMAAVSAKSAEKNSNSACFWFLGQPKQPKAVKKLRKF
ncbi:MAG: cyclic lactone autoinducer peptide [Oscillospiraceae bacterium]|nr:cyclic lactone autoinducer peptide [Oscillospiraceae bacterium]